MSKLELWLEIASHFATQTPNLPGPAVYKLKFRTAHFAFSLCSQVHSIDNFTPLNSESQSVSPKQRTGRKTKMGPVCNFYCIASLGPPKKVTDIR